MKQKLIKFLATSAVVSVLFTTTGCSQRPFMASMMQGGVPVESIILKSKPVKQTDIYQAMLISRYSVSLQPQVAGQISNIYVKAGDRVRTGQLLMVIDKRKQEATLNSSRAAADATKASISQAKDLLYNYQVQREALKSNLTLNKQLFDRYTALYAKRSVSQQDFEKYTDSYNKAKIDLDANAAQIQAQKSAILAAQSNYKKALANTQEQSVQLQYYKITAPYSGVIGDIPVKVGNYVNLSSPLLSITQNNSLEINAGLPVEKVFDIHNGMPVEVLDNNGNIINKSKISFVSPRVDTNTQTILVKAIVNNRADILKADQSVKVRVIYNQSPGILVPLSSISHIGGQDFAFILTNKGNKFFVKQIPVKLGGIQNNEYVVLSGLKNNDQIVSQGIQKLRDGVPVTILQKENK
ncbi:MAG: efflux RND transporter periplasmic adaptor subunit [Candidatus Gastranaerophilales bacterium]|nr:efflux RND transporter periplasmic adaptor subunit [Candidatus Gastranaerophilales bacterium]